jgi:hypothetical protein
VGRSRFVKPEVVRLPLSEGDWLDVRKRLTVGEERAAFQQIVSDVGTEGGRWKPNFEMIGVAQVAAYVVGWSLVDDEGIAVPFSVEAVQGLEPASFREIEQAVDAHIKRVEEELAASKNGTGVATASATTLQSVG